ncbi:MAG: DNA repair protein RadA [Chromatiales bacterium]|nr:MAG: DNA repair protein RadA [Chromatiales bacterium]
MAKARTTYRCAECGAASPKWQGQCAGCGAWNTLEPARAADLGGYAGEVRGRRLADVDETALHRQSTGLVELDRVLGGGLVPGAVVLIGGDPGIGKSTLLLQAAAAAGDRQTLYVSGEESLAQIALRARRLEVEPAGLTVLAETRVEDIVALAREERPACLVVDSVQTVYSDALPSAPGSVNQLRECTAQLVRLAKANDIAVMLVGHVTKTGSIAGPRVLEHMVDAVLYFENQAGSRYRIVRAVKNRFGAANELGVFVMTEQGMREVKNPSAIFLSRYPEPVAGSVITAVHQGSRPLLVEIQALTDRTGGGSPRRLAVGLDQNRMALLLAALHRHGGVATYDEDVFLNVVGGVKIAETAADLAALLATVSSLHVEPVPASVLVFGEVGLAGEIRPVAWGEERLREAAKLGFTAAIAPRANLPRTPISGLSCHGVATLGEALTVMRQLAAGEAG